MAKRVKDDAETQIKRLYQLAPWLHEVVLKSHRGEAWSVSLVVPVGENGRERTIDFPMRETASEVLEAAKQFLEKQLAKRAA